MHSTLNRGASVFRLLLHQIGGIATIVSVFVQYFARDLMQGHVEPLSVGFTYIFGIQKGMRFHREWTLLNIYCVHFNFGWATCAPERYVAKPAGVIMRHQYAPAPR